MRLIAESGSSKTIWCAKDKNDKSFTFTTAGFNPVVQNREQILGIIKNEVCPYLKDYKVSRIYFYGAGCSAEEHKKVMFASFKNFFNLAEVEIEHDLLGAARGLWGDDAGIVCILGTGSNSCVYNGKEIVDEMPSLGYVLGDDGSGAYMGRQVIRDYMYEKMPEELSHKLRVDFQLSKERMLQKVYKSSSPNRWLASFSFFIRENINTEYCQNLVMSSFNDFFENHITHYQSYKNLSLGAVGSIAFHYKDFLIEAAKNHGFNLSKVVKTPIDELVKYHNQVEALG